ncbi:MAG: hypothetical protein ABJD07_04805 [Gemmatimonadaceae bacterium]
MDFRFLKRPFYGIPPGDQPLAAAVLGLGLQILGFARRFAIVRLANVAQRTTTKLDDVLVERVRQTTPANRDYLDAQREIGVGIATELVSTGVALVYVEPVPAP